MLYLEIWHSVAQYFLRLCFYIQRLNDTQYISEIRFWKLPSVSGPLHFVPLRNLHQLERRTVCPFKCCQHPRMTCWSPEYGDWVRVYIYLSIILFWWHQWHNTILTSPRYTMEIVHCCDGWIVEQETSTSWKFPKQRSPRSTPSTMNVWRHGLYLIMCLFQVKYRSIWVNMCIKNI